MGDSLRVYNTFLEYDKPARTMRRSEFSGAATTTASSDLVSCAPDRSDSTSELSAAAFPSGWTSPGCSSGGDDDRFQPPAAWRPCYGNSTNAKHQDSPSPGSEHPAEIATTTVLLRNLPGNYKDADVDALLNGVGLHYKSITITYTRHGGRLCNKGYAFVELNSVSDANWCLRSLHGWQASSTKRILAEGATSSGPHPSRVAQDMPASYVAHAGHETYPWSGPQPVGCMQTGTGQHPPTVMPRRVDGRSSQQDMGMIPDEAGHAGTDAPNHIARDMLASYLAHAGREDSPSLGSEHPAEIATTTVLLRNLPGNYKDTHVDALLNGVGLHYKSISIPCKRRRRGLCNKGYAFVELNSVSDANWCLRSLNGWQASSTKRILADKATSSGPYPNRVAQDMPASYLAHAGHETIPWSGPQPVGCMQTGTGQHPPTVMPRRVDGRSSQHGFARNDVPNHIARDMSPSYVAHAGHETIPWSGPQPVGCMQTGTGQHPPTVMPRRVDGRSSQQDLGMTSDEAGPAGTDAPNHIARDMLASYLAHAGREETCLIPDPALMGDVQRLLSRRRKIIMTF